MFLTSTQYSVIIHYTNWKEEKKERKLLEREKEKQSLIMPS